MQDGWGSSGTPDENTKLPLVTKVQSLMDQDLAVAQGSSMLGFQARQAAQGFRTPAPTLRPPEVNVGALMDLGS